MSKKTCKTSLCPLTARGEGVEGLAEASAKNASFFDVLPKLIINKTIYAYSVFQKTVPKIH